MWRFVVCLGLISFAISSPHRCLALESADDTGENRLARVADEWITEADVAAPVDELFLQAVSEKPERFSQGEAGALRARLIAERLNDLIDVKLILLDVRKRLDNAAISKVKETIAHDFEKREVPKMLAKQKLESRAELKSRLKLQGASLERRKQAYVEQQLAFGWLSQQARSSKTPDDRKQAMRDYLAQLKETYPVKMGDAE